MAARDGSNRGGARPGAGRKPKPRAEKIIEGKKAKVIPAPPDLEANEMPDVKDYLSDDQRMGDFYAREIYEETWQWLRERHCDQMLSQDMYSWNGLPVNTVLSANIRRQEHLLPVRSFRCQSTICVQRIFCGSRYSV